MSVRLLIALAALGLAASGAVAVGAPAPSLFQGPALAQDRVLARAVGALQVSSTALGPDGALPLSATGYGRSVSFPVSWTPVPEAKGYALVMEEIDPQYPRTLVYWLVYNIPPTMTGLGHAVHNKADTEGPNGYLQGMNSFGGIGYFGPHPPLGDPAHRYHVEVFALSRPLQVKGGVRLDPLIRALNDRVLAEGELVVSFQPPRPGADAASEARP
jgi:Raf kinase inhibitor-like YbhB/YbcL family protein